MKKSCFSLLMVVCLLLGVASCKPSLPGNVLSKGKMADILYDYHVALSMARTADGGDDGKSIAYREAVLKKHDVTSAEFDSSMVYYMRHTELLEDVYKDLGDRLSNEITALGGNGDSGGRFGNLSATGDTANVWNLAPALVFSTVKPFNNASFVVKADSTFHKGDRLMLDFDAQFIYQDGMRDGIALLAVQFGNDSIAQRVIHIQSSMHYSVEVSDDANLGIKSVKGYLMLSEGNFSSGSSSATTLKLMFLEHIKLIRMHQPKPVASPSTDASGSSVDSLKKDSAASTASSVTATSSVSSVSTSSAPAAPARTLKGMPLKPVPVKLQDDKALKPMKMTK